jgi:hypothetical protein
MKKMILLLLVAVCAFAANSVMTSGVALNAHPQPAAEYEFYWDDGIMTSGWAWYTGGNYWAVQFDDVKTGGDDDAYMMTYGATTYANWPDSTFQGCNMHTFSDLGGYPGSDLGYEYLQFTQGGVFQWIDADPPVVLTTSVFYIAFQQIGNYPSCDSIGVDAVAGTHDWTGYQGSWSPTTANGDYLIRCYWEEDGPGGGAIESTTWGAVKALY